MIDPNSAPQALVSIPGVIHAPNQNSSAFRTMANSPKVRHVNGKVSKPNTGLMKALMNPATAPKISTDSGESNSISRGEMVPNTSVATMVATAYATKRISVEIALYSWLAPHHGCPFNRTFRTTGHGTAMRPSPAQSIRGGDGPERRA